MGGGMVEPEQCAADLNSGQAVSQRYSRGRLVPGFERHAGVRMQLGAGLRRPRKRSLVLLSDAHSGTSALLLWGVLSDWVSKPAGSL